MDYEKKYKSLVEAVKTLKEANPSDEGIQNWVKDNVPELEEDEDERIREVLIDYFKTYKEQEECGINTFFGIPTDNILAWLEKQGDYNRLVEEMKERKELLSKEKEKATSTNDKLSLGGRIAILGELLAFTKEKQGEHKPYGQREDCSDCQVNYAGECKGSCELKRKEQKPADKVESKFHAGDFITDGKRIFQIKETVWERNNRNDGSTYCESLIVNLRDGNTYANNTDLKEYHLWTIEDAKDGDALCDGTTIFIFKDLLSDGSVMSYCDYDTDSGESNAFCPLSVNLICSKITPATKEQRNTLERAMTNAGYRWDKENLNWKKYERSRV